MRRRVPRGEPDVRDALGAVGGAAPAGPGGRAGFAGDSISLAQPIQNRGPVLRTYEH